MDLVTKANVTENVYFMNRNEIQSGTVNEIGIKVYFASDKEKIIITYKLIRDNGVIDTNWYDEDQIFLTAESLVKKLLLKTSIESLTE